MAALDDLVSNLKNAVTNISNFVINFNNAYPAPTETVSPAATGFSLSTASSVLVASSTTRHGVVFHNPGTTCVYVYPTAIATAPTTAAPGGSFLILPAATLSFPSVQFPTGGCGWSGFAGTGSGQAFTVVEFF